MNRRRICVLGATGTIGQATLRALVRRGHEVIGLVRARQPGTGPHGRAGPAGRVDGAPGLPGAQLRTCDVADPRSLRDEGFRGEHFDAVVSCLASRTGIPAEAWAIDCQAHQDALAVARSCGVTHFVLLSAICVQKPRLEFQKAKLAFELALAASGVTYSIVRPTAFFKSLSGQIERVKAGKPFLLFGDGRLTACKPISDDDLGEYLADCLDDVSRHNRVLPIGGPGPAITPREQGECLFRLAGRAPRFRHVPVALLDVIVAVLGALGRFVPALRGKAEYARIGRYYATESMLVLDPHTGRYDAAATPSTGTQTLFDYYGHAMRDSPPSPRAAQPGPS